MNASQRRLYHTRLWPAAAAARGWEPRDQERRRALTLATMRAIRAPETDSTRDLPEAAVTALFCHLRHLAAPADLRLSAAWVECQEDYIRYNQLRQGDYWRRRAGYAPRSHRSRIDRDRFAARTDDGLFEAPTLTTEQSEQYLLTMRRRALARRRKTHAA